MRVNMIKVVAMLHKCSVEHTLTAHTDEIEDSD